MDSVSGIVKRFQLKGDEMILAIGKNREVAIDLTFKLEKIIRNKNGIFLSFTYYGCSDISFTCDDEKIAKKVIRELDKKYFN